MSRKILLAGTGCALMLASLAVQAAQSGWFFGIGVGRADGSFVAGGLSLARAEEKDPWPGLLGGYRYNFSGVDEPGDLDLGRYGVHGVTTGQPFSDLGQPRRLKLQGKGTLAVTDKLGLYGKLGALYTEPDTTCSLSSLTCPGSEPGKDLSYGLGLRYDFTKSFSVQGEWERSHRLGELNRATEGDVNFFSIGLGFKF